jgi:RNA polymerase sigma factor (sigma-70 family)
VLIQQQTRKARGINQDPANELSGAALDARFRRPLMRFFMRRVGNHGDAEDFTQQTFARLLGMSADRNVEDIAALIFTVATNLLRDRNRQEIRRGDRVSVPDPEMISAIAREYIEERTPERVLVGKETLNDVLRSLNELGELTRDIFILFRLENMKQKEIAALYCLSLSTVEKHVMKATLHLALRYGSR